jgi:hypothetical protein
MKTAGRTSKRVEGEAEGIMPKTKPKKNKFQGKGGFIIDHEISLNLFLELNVGC